MGRPRKQNREPFWFADRGAWYVHVGTTKKRLSPDKDEAWRLWHELMARPPEPDKPRLTGPDVTALAILDAFLDWCQKHKAPRTYDWYRDFFQYLAGHISHTLKVTELKPFHLTEAMDAKPDWSNNTRNDFVTAVKRAFNWALDDERIERNPIGRMKKPARESRELAVSPADFTEIMSAIEEPNFRQLLEFAWETGVRPQEVVKIEARHVQPEQKRIVFPPKEAKGKKRHRIVYLTDAGMAMLLPLMEQRPSGAIFRNSEEAAWVKDAINCAFCRLRLRLAERMMERDGYPHPTVRKVPRKQLSQARAERRAAVVVWKKERLRYAKECVPKFHMGAWRKGYATEAIKSGVDLSALAGLLGHRDGRMVATVYSKVTQDQEHMGRMAEKAKGPRPESTTEAIAKKVAEARKAANDNQPPPERATGI